VLFCVQMKTSTMTVRIPVELKRRLDRLACSTTRSRAWLAQDAIESYVTLNEWHVQAIHQGMNDADAARFVEHTKIAAWLRTWGGSSEKKPPR
jgi:predicted transcriptional regulator